MWSCKVYLDDFKLTLQKAHILFSEKQYANEREYLKAHFRHPNLKGRSDEPVFVLMIDGDNDKTPVWLEFQPGEAGMAFYDLYFGGYGFEMFQNGDEYIPQSVVETIHDILSGKIHVIASWNTENFAWNGDAAFCIAPGEDEDDSAEYEQAVRKIERPKSRFERMFCRSFTYAIYSWNSYREVKR